MTKEDFQLVVGLEFHVELATKSKMFCSCSGEIWNEPPNTHVCPVCLGLPGAMPVANRQAIKKAILLGIALNCQPQQSAKFDRKNYFYPDLPKGFQISQYDLPFTKSGWIKIETTSNKGQVIRKKIGINRVHLEEDTGKLIHSKGATLIDFNRSGIPLVEIVTEPEIETASQARLVAQKLQQIVRYLAVSEADMERGSMRVEANISVRKVGEKKLGTKVEVKNLNSFRSVEKSIEFEFGRQVAVLKKRGRLIQETRGWNEIKNQTFTQRTKEFAHDYRYFPEPDLLPFNFDQKLFSDLKKQIVELPEGKRERFKGDYGLSGYDASVLTSSRELASWYEEAIKAYAQTKVKGIGGKPTVRQAKLVANWVIGELLRRLKQTEKTLAEIPMTPAYLAEFLYLLDGKKITQAQAKDIFWQVFQTGKRPETLAKEFEEIADQDLEIKVDEVIGTNEKVVLEIKSGKLQAIHFLVGQVMKKTAGKADPKVVEEILKKKLS